MTVAFEHFVQPLSACFNPRPGQDFMAFAKQLMQDLESYSASVLDEAAADIRRNHDASTWPTIAKCLEAARRAAHRQYKPPEKPDEAPKKLVPMPKIKIDPGGGMLSMAEMRSCPVGTQFWACDATIRYTNGSVESWAEFRRRRYKIEDAA